MELPSRLDVISQARSEGRRIAAVLPIHYPRALLRAYGFHPVEVWGPPGVTVSKDDSHFQAYTCAIVQNATYFLTNAGRQHVDCIVIPHTCDALQGMGSVFQCFIKPSQPVLTLHHPRGRRACDLDFLADELERLAGKLRQISEVDPAESELHAAMDTESKADRAFAELAHNRAQIALSDREYYAALRTREYLTAEAFCELVATLPQGEAPVDGLPLFVSGIVPEPMSLFDELATLGAHVVGDDLACCGRRLYAQQQDANPFRRMARHLMSAPPDPTVSSPIHERNAFLADRMKNTGARGLLVYDVKFCEPELFYLPILQREFKAAGWPVLHVEVELGDRVPRQAVNRIAAFLEMMQ